MINHIFRKGYFQIMPSSGPSLTHEECRSRLCVCCGLKQKRSIAMTEAEEPLVKIPSPYPTFDRFNPCYPTALCPSCRRALYKVKAKQVPKGWRDCHPPSWKKFNANKIFGVRKCGTFDYFGML